MLRFSLARIMSKVLPHRAPLWSGQTGQVVYMMAFAAPVVIGVLGLAIDLGALFHHRRRMQTAADAAALSGAHERWRGRTTEITNSAQREAGVNGFTDGSDGVTVAVNNPPATGSFVGNQIYVEATVNQNAPTYFMKIFGWQEVPVSARAVAGAGANSQNCMYVLDPTMHAALWLQSSVQVNASCGVCVNSTDPEALLLESSAHLDAGYVSVTGDYATYSSSTISTTPDTGAIPCADPLAWLPEPSFGSCDHTNYYQAEGSHVLSPGVYCGGIRLDNNASVTFSPGTFILYGGGMRLTSNANVTGEGVTFYNTEGDGFPYAPIITESSTAMHLSAPTTGTYAGILFYQDPEAGSPTDVNAFMSSGNSYLEGALYFPTQILRLESSAILDAPYTLVVARAVEIQSSVEFNMNHDFSSLPGGSPIKRMSLVE